ncbi:MAG: D-alanyl-D-alanine carboxypeptidase [Schwartzia sp.]|nr:D-alanyl-D-alanine carboxypeptidase [Schwartzia sp. (in: firmicutes)]
MRNLFVYLLMVCLWGLPATAGAIEVPVLPVPEEAKAYIPPGDALPNVTARSAVVIEASTGHILYQRAMDRPGFPASTTKMMTLLVALERGNPEEIVTVSAEAADTEGSTVWLEAGERIRLRDLLYGLMLVSGNDAAVAIAEHIAGSPAAFGRLMTEKARAIGANDTFFTNPSGLPDPRHITTAHDMARIAAYGFRQPGFAEIVSTRERRISSGKAPFFRNLENENMLLWIYDGANGVKTGYTDDAGRCLVSAAKRNGCQLIVVVLDSVYMWNDSIALLDYGFQRVRPRTLLEEGQRVSEIKVRNGFRDSVPLVAAARLTAPDFAGDAPACELRLEVPEQLTAPVRSGEVVGRAVAFYQGRPVANVDIRAARAVEEASLLARLWQFIRQILPGMG